MDTSRNLDPDAGHLFVVHGQLGDLTCDALVVTTDGRGRLGQHWLDATRADDHELDLAPGWTTVPSAEVLSFAVSIEAPYSEVLARVDRCLEEVRKTARRPLGRRTLPLVALPVVGIGAGGFGEDRGTVLRELVTHLTISAERLGLDIALVAPDPAVYAAAQYARRDLLPPLPPGLEGEALRLAESARRGSLAVFLGAGVSAPSGLPTWHELLEGLAASYGITEAVAAAENLSDTDVAGLIERTGRDRFQADVASLVKTGRHAPSLLHAMLAALGTREAVTTNYDLLFERAVQATGRDISSVLPWQSALGRDRWILKLHGDVEHPDKIVLTRRHMVRYDAANRPSAAMLQSLLLTRHTLFVGVSMSDDNVTRLMHEVEEYRSQNQPTVRDRFGTMLDPHGDDARRSLWQDQLDWVDLSGGRELAGFRMLELFLDRVAQRAARDSSWLLDKRFQGLLSSQEDRKLASDLRWIYKRLPQRDGTSWDPLLARLRELGVDPDSV